MIKLNYFINQIKHTLYMHRLIKTRTDLRYNRSSLVSFCVVTGAFSFSLDFTDKVLVPLVDASFTAEPESYPNLVLISRHLCTDWMKSNFFDAPFRVLILALSGASLWWSEVNFRLTLVSSILICTISLACWDCSAFSSYIMLTWSAYSSFSFFNSTVSFISALERAAD